jgi:hypothetical protein
MRLRNLACLLLLAPLASCDLAEEPFRPQLVVQGLLVAGEPLPPIRLSRTFPITEPIDTEVSGVLGATVTVQLLGDDGEPDQTVSYSPGGLDGRYFPETPFPVIVQPLRRYRLTVSLPDDAGLLPPGQFAGGETLVPDTFTVVTPPPDSLRYNPFSTPPELRVSSSFYPGRQAVYLFSITALEPERFGLTPTYAELVDPEDIPRLVQGTSPLLNEGSYDRNPDGTINLRIPWLAIAFYGPSRFTASALDDGLFDFLRSREAQFGATTLSPGEIPEVLTNLTNAVGVFGSVAQREVTIFISP